MHPNMPRMGTEGEQTLTGTQRHPVMSVSGKGAPYPWGTEGLGAENVLRVSAQGWRVAGLPNTPLPASWLPTSCAQGGTVPILRAGPGVPTMSQHGANRCQADVAVPRWDCECDNRDMGLRRPCAHSVGQFPHVLGRRGHSKVPGSADTIRGVSGPTATPLVSTTMLGAVCLVLLLGYGGCRAWGRVGAGGTGPWGLPGPWARAQAASDVPLPRVTQPMDAASRPCHHS